MKLSLCVVALILIEALCEGYLGHKVDLWYVVMGILGWLCVALLESLRAGDRRRLKALYDESLERELVFQTRLSQISAEMQARTRRFG